MSRPSFVGRELKTLARQSSHYILGILSGFGLGFISFPIFTRIFSIAQYGQIDYVLKLILLLVALSKVGAQNSVLRFYDHGAFAADPDRRRSYYSTILFGVIGISALLAGMVASFAHYIPLSVLDAPTSGLLAFAAVLIVVRSIQSLQWAFLRVEERTKAYNIYAFMVRGGTILSVLCLLPILGTSVRTYLTGVILCEVLISAFMIFPLVRRGLLSIRVVDLSFLRMSFSFGLPLVLQELAGIVLDSGDRVLVQRYLGANPLGYYSVAYGLSSYVSTLIMTPLGLAIPPIYMRLWRTEGLADTARFLGRSLDAFVCMSTFLLMLVLIGSRDGVLILASSKYAGADRLIPILATGLLIYGAQIFLNAGLLIHKRTFEIAVALGISAFLNVILNCALLPRMGIAGAAWATLISYAFCTLWLARRSFHVLPIRVATRSLVTYVAALLAGWFLAMQVPISKPWISLAVKPFVGSLIYISILLIFDSRAREIKAQLWRSLRGRLFMNSEAAVSP